MLLSFTVLQIMGVTLNVVVLFSLTLALGMLVDNAIVIVENIYRYMEQGASRFEAAKRATSEVAYPVIGSTLTTLAAFSPMLWYNGRVHGVSAFDFDCYVVIEPLCGAGNQPSSCFAVYESQDCRIPKGIIG